MLRAFVLSWLAVAVSIVARGAEVSGRIAMPETCSPAISPAVLILEPIGGAASRPQFIPARVTLVNQRGLQFEPRVRAMTVGQTLKFTNADAETHNVHILADGTNFSQSMAPGREVSHVPERPGVLRLVCDIHGHMRGFVVVSGSPWVSVCDREGRFRIRDVPEGRYAVKVWHELGGFLDQPSLDVAGEGTIDLKTIVVGGAGTAGEVVEVVPARTWGEVIDRIGVRLAESLEAATRHDPGKARSLADDAYFVEFEGSDMEAAVRSYLGFEKKGELEDQFRAFRREVREIAEKREPSERGTDLSGRLLLNLSRSAEDLNRRGIVDRSKIAATAGAGPEVVVGGDRRSQWIVLAKALERVRELADGGDPVEAAAAMTDAYFDGFEPMEGLLWLETQRRSAAWKSGSTPFVVRLGWD